MNYSDEDSWESEENLDSHGSWDSDSGSDSSSDSGSHEHGHGRHSGDCDGSSSGSSGGCNGEDHHGAGMGFMFFCVILVAVVAVTVVILCFLKKRAKRTRSVANLRVITVAPTKGMITTPKSTSIFVPDMMHPKAMEAGFVLSVASAPSQVAQPLAPPEYKSTVDLRSNITSPPPNYDA